MNTLEVQIARKRNGLKQKDMAERMGMSETCYRYREHAGTFSDREKKQMAEILGLSPWELNEYLYDGLLPIPKP